jgi:hypothetical protein
MPRDKRGVGIGWRVSLWVFLILSRAMPSQLQFAYSKPCAIERKSAQTALPAGRE